MEGVVQRAKELTGRGAAREALDLLLAHLVRAPRDAVAWRELGRAHRALGDRDAALAAAERAADLAPRDAAIANGLGVARAQAGDDAGARRAWERAARLRPGWAVPWQNLAEVARRRKDLRGEVRALAEAIRAAPDERRVRALGAALRALDVTREPEVAAPALAVWLELHPDDAESHMRLGHAHVTAGRNARASDAYQRALELDPALAQAWYGLALSLQNRMLFVEAEVGYRRATELDPSMAEAWNNLGQVLKNQGRIPEGRSAYAEALRVQPDKANSADNLLFAAHYDPAFDAAHIGAEHRDWGRRVCPAPPPRRVLDPDPDRPLRVGFVGADFGRHPVGWFLAGWWGRHDRDRILLHGYSGREPSSWDDLTERFRAGADGWRETLDMGDDALFEAIRADRVDVLVDLSGHTRGNRLLVFARRAAPVQLTWAGYVGTTGLPTMDWLLSDARHSPPGAESWTTERIHRLPHYVCYEPPAFAPAPAPPPSLASGRPAFGCFNNLSKLSPPTLDLWAAVLREVPGSTLLLKTKQLADPALRERLAGAFAARGVDPARLTCEDRSPQDELLARYGAVDVALDPLPYSGGLTTLEALWMGVPVVTLPGDRFCSRHSAAHLGALGLDECVATDPADYVRRAAALAGDPARLAALREGLRPRMASSILCDGPGFAESFTRAVREMWREACRS